MINISLLKGKKTGFRKKQKNKVVHLTFLLINCFLLTLELQIWGLILQTSPNLH